MAETIVLMSFAQPAVESARSLKVPAEEIDQLLRLITEFDSLAKAAHGPDRTQTLVSKTREIHALAQKIKVAAVARIGGAGELANRPDCGTFIDRLQKIRDMAALEATRRG